MSFFKTGAAAAAAQEQEATKVQANTDSIWRFFMKKGESRTLTFLTGNLGEDGLFAEDVPFWKEHGLKLGGKWTQLACIADHPDSNGECPLCDISQDRGNPYQMGWGGLVAGFLVIDHTQVTGKKATYQNQLRLFIAKRNTQEVLHALAEEYGGLAGATFKVTRSTGDQSPAVGNTFMYREKNSVEDLVQSYILNDENQAKLWPVDWEKQVNFKNLKELAQMGFGGEAPFGSDSTGQHASSTGNTSPAGGSNGGVKISNNYANEL